MADNEVPRVWIHSVNSLRQYRLEKCTDCDDDIPYVPANELARVWDKAIAIVADYQRLDRDEFYRRYQTAMLRDALETARDESEG